MGKSKKYILNIIFVFVLSLLLFACNSKVDENKEYNIVYIYNGEVFDLQPSKYTPKDEVELPKLNENGFVGWYDNSSLTGDVITKIEKGSSETKVFYAKVEKVNSSESLEEIVKKMTNYRYDYHYEDADKEDVYNSTNYVDNGKEQYNYSDAYDNVYTEYLYIKENGEYCYIFVGDDGEYYYAHEGTDLYDEFTSYPDIIDLSIIKDNKFDYDESNKNYVYNDSKTVNDFGKSLIGDYEDEVITSIIITVKDGFIDNIIVKSTYSYYGSKYYYTYTVKFSEYEKVKLTLPNAKEYEEDPAEKTETGIQVSQACYTVTQGKSFEEVLNNVVISLVYSDGTSEVVKNSDCTFKHAYSQSTLGSYDVTVTYKKYTTTFKIDVVTEIDPVFTASEDTLVIYDVISTMCEYEGEVYGVTTGLSTKGGNVLVIPVDFTDYKADSTIVSNLEKAFFGTSEDTGWESLQSYYYKTSYGIANITGKVLPVYSTNKSSSYFEKLEDDAAVAEIIKGALTKYDSQINYGDYDTNNDGYIDALYIVYTAPVNNDDDNSLYWAFTTEYVTDELEYYDNVEADYYTFLGYDFLYEELACGKKVKLNTETIIHESGHIFGFDDYYDYDENKGPDGGIGGGDMMDYNVGDHNPFTKAIAGWIRPSILDISKMSSTVTLSLESFGKTGNAIIIANGWNGTYFDEYYIIDFYTPDGLNALEAGYSGLFSVCGVRIYHIDARLDDPKNATTVFEMTKYENTSTAHKLIQLVQADGLDEIEKNNAYGGNEDLFSLNSSYSNFTFYKGNSISISMKVIQMTNSDAKLEFSIK